MRKKILPLIALAGSLVFSKVHADNSLEAIVQNTNPIVKLFEEEKETPKIDSNYGFNINESYCYFNKYNQMLGGDFPYTSLTNNERTQVETRWKEIINNSSYEDLINNSTNFSENQKLAFLASTSAELNKIYDSSYQGKIITQDRFLEAIRNYIQNKETSPIGVCRHIASYIEQFANDINIRTASVTGATKNEGHVFNLSKLNEGLAIIDYSKILKTNTKNVEDVLRMRQNMWNTINFQNLFFEGPQFQYRLINKDGRNFLDFIDYDETTRTIKNSLVSKTENENSKYYKTNFGNSFQKVGRIYGDNLSAFNYLDLVQIGNSKNWKDKCSESSLNSSFTLGKEFFGISGELLNKIKLNNFNIASRINGNIEAWHENTFKGTNIFSDTSEELGISGEFQIKDSQIKPYLIGQLMLAPGDIGTYTFIPTPNELRAGIDFNYKTPKIDFSLEPYFVRRIWENEFGANLKIKPHPKVGLNLEGYLTKSTYDFCPDKAGIKARIDFPIGKINAQLEYKLDQTNYDGQIDKTDSLILSGSSR